MSSLPHFADLSKPLNDLLNKDYSFGIAKLEINSVSANNVKFTAIGNKDNKSGQVASELKAKYSDKKNGLTITETWNTSNVLSLQLELQDAFAKGLKLEVNSALLPVTGQKNLKVGGEIKQSLFFTRGSLDLFKGPTLQADTVISLGANTGLVIGSEAAYDLNDAKVTRFNATLGYLSKEYSAIVNANNSFTSFTAGYHHHVRSGVEAGAKACWNCKESAVNIEIGSKYVLDKDSFVKAKVNNNGMLGLGYTQSLREGVKLGLGIQFDTTKFGENTHKLGGSLTFDL